MRRLFAGFLAGAFLALVGVQSAHAHDAAASPVDSCAICTLAHQAQRQAPAAAPVLVSVSACFAVAVVVPAFAGADVVVLADARAPPFAS